MTLRLGKKFKHRPELTGSGARLTTLARQVSVAPPPAAAGSPQPPPRTIPLPPQPQPQPLALGPQPSRRRGNAAAKVLAGFATVLVAAGLSVVGWRIVTDTEADHGIPGGPGANITALSAAAARLDQAAFDQLKRKGDAADLVAARHDAEQALRTDPLDTRAVALLALIADRGGDHDRADALMNLASQRTYRDPAIESWMMMRNLQLEDSESALSHADVLLRTHPELRPMLLRMFVEMTGNPAARQALVEMLASAPPWRHDLLQDLAGRVPDSDRLTAIFTSLHEGPHPPTVDELRPYLTRLIADGRYSDAYRGWIAMAAPKNRVSLSARPYDGDFSADPSGTPFDWTMNSVPGARIDIVPTPNGGTGRALRVQFSGARVSFKNVSQLMLLAPGEYHLSGMTRASDLQTSRGLRWRIECADPSKATLAETGPISGTMPWTGFAVDFRVPSEGCQAQWLQLELPARTATEHQIAGEVWYRNLRISAETAQGASIE
jgi:hypothetical protein